MKIQNRFIEPIPLDTINDDVNGARVAMRPGAQTLKGTKTFENLRVASDSEKDDKSLINVEDMNYALATVGNPVTATESVTLTAADIANKSVTLEGAPHSDALVKFSLEGSGVCYSALDFTVTGQSISWANNAELCDILEAGDVLNFRYYTVKEAA